MATLVAAASAPLDMTALDIAALAPPASSMIVKPTYIKLTGSSGASLTIHGTGILKGMYLPVTQGITGYDLVFGGVTVQHATGFTITGSEFDKIFSGTVRKTTALEWFWRGNDKISGSSHADKLLGLAGNDTVDGGSGADQIYGGNGNDKLIGGLGDDTAYGDAGTDTVDAGEGNDTVVGGAGNDTLSGGAGDDTLDGGSEADRIEGGAGKDIMTGGAGADTFVFRSVTDTAKATLAADIIKDFRSGTDQIDVSPIDAQFGVAGEQAFTYRDAGAFTHTKGELRVTSYANGAIYVQGDINGDGVADFQIKLTGVQSVTVNDFIL